MKRDLVRLTEKEHDVLIIGGGIYGLFLAWDAVLRGLSVALVEKGDFGQGTSFNTLRIIHGGFRYLQHGDIPRMRQSIRERAVFMRIAPHLVHPLPFLIPTYGHLMRGREIFTLALAMGDVIGFDRNRFGDPDKHLPRGRMISRSECLRLFPGVEEKGLNGGAIFHDSQMYSSERLVLSVARSAHDAGAAMANYVEVSGFLTGGGRVSGVKARDVLTGDELEIRARLVVNTSGPWIDRVLGLLGGRRFSHRMVLSKAFNLLIRRQLVPDFAVGVYGQRQFKDRDAVIAKGYRLYIATPWRGRSLIGTVHLPYAVDPDRFEATGEEIESFLSEFNRAYSAANLKREDISWVYGGLLPMAEQSRPDPFDVPLVKNYEIYDHQRLDGIEGVVSVMGVKFTESRHVAEKTVDLIFRKMGKSGPLSRTAELPIHGGNIERFGSFFGEELARNTFRLDPGILKNLLYRYGTSYSQVLKHADSNGPGLDRKGVLKAEILHGAREEMAQTLADVVIRRTEVPLSGDPDRPTVEFCASVMGAEMGWDPARTRRESEETVAALGGKPH